MASDLVPSMNGHLPILVDGFPHIGTEDNMEDRVRWGILSTAPISVPDRWCRRYKQPPMAEVIAIAFRVALLPEVGSLPISWISQDVRELFRTPGR